MSKTRQAQSAMLLLAFLVGIITAGPAMADQPGPPSPSPHRLSVKIERDTTRTEDAPAGVLGLPILASVLDAATGQLDPTVYDVYVTPIDGNGTPYERNEMTPRSAAIGLGKDARPGQYTALVLFSRPGPWKLHVTVNQYRSELDTAAWRKPPVTLAEAEQDFVVEGQARASAGRERVFGRDKSSKPRPPGLETGMLWIHSLFAMGWGAVVAVLIVLALPGGRRLLSKRGLTLLDQRFKSLERLLFWVTAVVIGTGIFNLKKGTPYRTPFSPAQVHQVFRLDYGKPYFLALAVKLAMYAVMLVALVPLVRAARALAEGGEHLTVVLPHPAAPERPREHKADLDPWSRSSGLTGGVGTLGTKIEPVARTASHRNEAQSTVEEAANGPAPARSTWITRGAVATMIVGAPVLGLCVTLLKTLHITIESLRFWP